MNKLREIRSFSDLKDFLILNKELIKKAALPITVAAALLFFWGFGGDDKEKIRETDVPPDEQAAETLPEEEEQPKGDIYVDISGCVNKPGVYRVASGTRLFQLIEEAGGLTEEADTEGINRAEEVYDGQKINIYPIGAQTEAGKPSQKDGRININRADSEELQQIPGVGPATAQKILEHRQQVGRFTSPEDIKKVSGIGEKTFESMREYITV